MPTPGETSDEDLKRLAEAGRYDTAIEAAMRRFGRELYRFLATQLPASDADDASSELWAEAWKALPKFEWRSSVRTWLYVIARRSVAHILRSPHRKRGQALTDTHASRLEAHLRTSVWYLREEAEDKLADLKRGLSTEERALLYLRIDQNLSWTETTTIVLGRTADTKDVAALRQKFSRLTARLRDEAQRAGLVPER